MTREDCLQLMMLLSAIESWSFAENHRLTDYLLDDIHRLQDKLRAEVLK